MDDDFNDLGDWDRDYFAAVDRIIAAHRIYMDFFGRLELARFHRGMDFSAMRILRFMAEREWAPSIVLVADRLRMHHSHASHLLKRLETEGRVRSDRDSVDGRVRRYTITESGLGLHRAFEEEVQSRAA